MATQSVTANLSKLGYIPIISLPDGQNFTTNDPTLSSVVQLATGGSVTIHLMYLSKHQPTKYANTQDLSIVMKPISKAISLEKITRIIEEKRLAIITGEPLQPAYLHKDMLGKYVGVVARETLTVDYDNIQRTNPKMLENLKRMKPINLKINGNSAIPYGINEFTEFDNCVCTDFFIEQIIAIKTQENSNPKPTMTATVTTSANRNTAPVNGKGGKEKKDGNCIIS